MNSRLQNQFFAYCSRDSRTGDNNIYLRKFTFDKSKYFVVPENQQSLDLHPFIKSAKNANFSKLSKSKANGFRHVALNKFDETGKESKESLKYIRNNRFCIDNRFLDEEVQVINLLVNLIFV